MSSAADLAPSRDYLKTLALSCEPFADSGDGQFFYAGTALMQRLDLLSHLTQFGDAAILVSGPAGSGKSTLLSRFVGERGRQWRLCAIHADEFEQFERRLGDALGIGETAPAEQMLSQWASQHEASQLAVIAVDDAQQLPAHAVQALRDLLTQAPGDRVRLILFLTPSALSGIKAALEQGPASPSTQLLEIPKLSEEETAAYLMYRLAVAGYSGESPFNATEVRAICKAADGRPGAINQLAHEALQEHKMRAGGKGTRPTAARPARRVTWGFALLLALGLAAYLGWQSRMPSDDTPAPAASRTDDEVARPLFLPEEPDAADGQAGASTEPPADTPSVQPPAVPSPPAPAAPAANVPPAPDIAPDGSLPPAETTPEAPATEAPSGTGDAQGTASGVTDETKDGGSTPEDKLTPPAVAPASPTPSTPATPSAPATGTQTGDEQPPAADSSPPTRTAPAAAAQASEPSTATAQTPATAQAALPHREDWLLRQPADHYTLQLLGSRRQASIIGYIEQNGLDPARCAYYRGLFQGSDWYVLVYGSYPDRAAALADRARLPTRIQREKPWPRTLADVHQAIRDAR